MAVLTDDHANGPSLVAVTIVVAQGVMIVASLFAMRLGEKHGLWIVLLVSFAALPIRGVLAAFLISKWGVYPVQFLDGIGAGLQSVAVPVLVARILNGTGRINVGQGAVMTAQGIGASLSPALGGWLSQELGYPAAFLILGSIAIGSVLIWIVFAAAVKQAAAVSDDNAAGGGALGIAA
jgi:MFS family permease